MTTTSANPRHFWRFAIVSLVLALGAVAVRGERIDDRPNILLIFADDLGWPDVSYQGARFIETPNIDRLAGEGMVFSSAYAGAANCLPSRACLLSGQYTPRHGAYAVGDTDRGPRELMRLIPIPNRDGLAESNLTLAEALQSAGYMTGIFGKWHLDGADGVSPVPRSIATDISHGAKISTFPSDFESRTTHGVIALMADVGRVSASVVACQCDNSALTPSQAGRRTLPMNPLS